MPDLSELVAAYDAQVRDRVPDPLPRGVAVERDGPLLRFVGWAGRGFVVYRDLGGLEGADLDELIARQVHVFAERGERFEWKLHGHDWPKDLPQRLRAAGFVPEDTETIVIAPVVDIAGKVQLPEGVALREVTSRTDLERIAALEQAVWGDEDQQTWLVDMLESERAVDPYALSVVVAEAWCHCRLRRVDPVRARHRVRDPLGRRDTAGVAPTWDLSRDRRLPREPRRRGRLPLPRDGRLRRQPPHSRASRLQRGDDDHAIRLVAARSGSGAVACLGVRDCRLSGFLSRGSPQPPRAPGSSALPECVRS